VSISKRIPKVNETVLLSVRTDGESSKATINVRDVDGKLVVSGEVDVAKVNDEPFSSAIEWTPNANGMYVVEGVAGETKVMLEVPVVTNSLYFAFYGPVDGLKYANIALTAFPKQAHELHARGMLALKSMSGVGYVINLFDKEIDPTKDDVSGLAAKFTALADTIYKDYTTIGPLDGISIDELGYLDDNDDMVEALRAYVAILKRVRQDFPNRFIAVWQFAGLTARECNAFRHNTDLVMMEVYQNFFRAWYGTRHFYEYIQQRIDMARTMMVLDHFVIGLSITRHYGSVMPSELEAQVRYIRLYAPDMPGLAFFTTGYAEKDIIKHADWLCYQYYIRPVVATWPQSDLTFSDYSPKEGDEVEIFANIHSIGGMDAQDVKVNFYDAAPAHGGQLIGTQAIDKLPTGYPVAMRGENDKSWEPAEDFRAKGLGMKIVSVKWRAKAGAHEFFVEIEPSDKYTVLQQHDSKRLFVGGK